jgi:hypothetical protein
MAPEPQSSPKRSRCTGSPPGDPEQPMPVARRPPMANATPVRRTRPGAADADGRCAPRRSAATGPASQEPDEEHTAVTGQQRVAHLHEAVGPAQHVVTLTPAGVSSASWNSKPSNPAAAPAASSSRQHSGGLSTSGAHHHSTVASRPRTATPRPSAARRRVSRGAPTPVAVRTRRPRSQLLSRTPSVRHDRHGGAACGQRNLGCCVRRSESGRRRATRSRAGSGHGAPSAIRRGVATARGRDPSPPAGRPGRAVRSRRSRCRSGRGRAVRGGPA